MAAPAQGKCGHRASAIYTAAVVPSLDCIDWRDFLWRPLFSQPSPQILDSFADTPLLITGAGGSIGSALALRLARTGPSLMVLLDASENHLHRLQQALDEAGAAACAEFVLGSAGDPATLDQIFLAHRPRIVYHAAAHKHVPLLERQPFAAIANNVFATEQLLSAATRHGARVVLLSTDKAVQPASVMGATKRAAEEMALNSDGIVLRLANVLASSGGVTEIFARQALRGDPLTVTDPAARRYFLTMAEAVNLLLAAGHIAMSDGSNALLVPDLATDHSIAELAVFIAHVLAPGREPAVQFTGLRPGEKLTERLRDDGERLSQATDGLLTIHSSRSSPSDLANRLRSLRTAHSRRDLTAALAQLRALAPGFLPSETVQALTQENAQWVNA